MAGRARPTKAFMNMSARIAPTKHAVIRQPAISAQGVKYPLRLRSGRTYHQILNTLSLLRRSQGICPGWLYILRLRRSNDRLFRLAVQKNVYSYMRVKKILHRFQDAESTPCKQHCLRSRTAESVFLSAAGFTIVRIFTELRPLRLS